MKLIPLYRVSKENHNPQYFFTKSLAEEFAEEMEAPADILYFYNEEQMLKTYNSMQKW